MYTPPKFEITDSAWIARLIDRYPFGSLVTGGEGYPRVSYLPMIAQEREDGLWLVGHVARANPHARSIAEQSLATLAFHGSHAYVSASWYEQPYENVPTWNYTAVQVCGRLRECDPWNALTLLSETMEAGRAGAWDPQRLPVAYRCSQMRGIAAFELRAEKVYAKAKLSQNRTGADRARVMRELSASSDQTDRECADAMAPYCGGGQ